MQDVKATTAEQLWTSFLSTDCTKLSKHVLDTWLKPVRCVAFENGVVTLEVQDQFFRDWLSDHYLDFILEGLARNAGHKVAIEWRINAALRSAVEAYDPKPETVEKSEERQPERYPTQLNSRFLFDSFVAGPSNEFAYAACKAVAEKPGQSYNPLFLFGGVGLGKTHLVSAIGHQILAARPSARIVYVSAEQFTNDVVNAVLNSKLEEFRNKYRRYCDLILVDDIQLIAGKERTQHEFFHIFNALYDSHRQIVVTSDKLPHEIPEIEERLRSRFQWGLIADIQPPEIETRIAILRKKATLEGVSLDDEVTCFLAESIRSNVRELEGALVRLLAHASLTRAPITIDYARQVLANVLEFKTQNVSVEEIQKVVADYYHVRIADLKSRRRVKTYVLPRQVAMYLCRKHTSASFPDIGSRFEKDHTTIMSACDKIEGNMKGDGDLRKQIFDLERKLDIARAP
jgi:chromosomal replication initiator protein